jgi:hypothetical protein
LKLRRLFEGTLPFSILQPLLVRLAIYLYTRRWNLYIEPEAPERRPVLPVSETQALNLGTA